MHRIRTVNTIAIGEFRIVARFDGKTDPGEGVAQRLQSRLMPAQPDVAAEPAKPAVTESVENTPGIDAKEADQIRQKWEDLKACLERFVLSCEKGYFAQRGPSPKR